MNPILLTGTSNPALTIEKETCECWPVWWKGLGVFIYIFIYYIYSYIFFITFIYTMLGYIHYWFQTRSSV